MSGINNVQAKNERGGSLFSTTQKYRLCTVNLTSDFGVTLLDL